MSNTNPKDNPYKPARTKEQIEGDRLKAQYAPLVSTSGGWIPDHLAPTAGTSTPDRSNLSPNKTDTELERVLMEVIIGDNPVAYNETGIKRRDKLLDLIAQQKRQAVTDFAEKLNERFMAVGFAIDGQVAEVLDQTLTSYLKEDQS